MKTKDLNLEYIKKGKTGCVFATIFSKNPKSIGWVRVLNPKNLTIPENALIVSFIFEDKTKQEVIKWALSQGMYEEETSKSTIGLRYKGEHGVSWVQYFGPDSHVETRRAPVSELLLCVKLPKTYYAKVGFKGVLHLAHASIDDLLTKCRSSTLDIIWNKCFESTYKRLGFKPTIKEAAKTTYIK